jgi:hypothetical protein
MLDHLDNIITAPKLRSNEQKKMQRHSKLITLKDHEGSNPKQKYTTQKNYIKIKII